jgi:CheY-like chemotaxis protein
MLCSLFSFVNDSMQSMPIPHSTAENNILVDNIIQNLCNKFKVVIVEDDEELQYQYREIFETYGCDPIFLTCINQVKQRIDYSNESMLYILDISLGKNRKTEGFEILEFVKNANPRNFVVLISTFISHYEHQLDKANMTFEKDTSLDVHIRKILETFLHHCFDPLKEINEKESIIPVTSQKSSSNNLEIYHNLLENTCWVQCNKGRFVAIANGEVIVNDQLEYLLDMIEKKYPNKERFFAQIMSTSELQDIQDMSFSMSF